MNTAENIGAAQSRLAKLKEAGRGFTTRLAALKRDLAGAAPRERRKIEGEIATLETLRVDADALLVEAQEQLETRETERAAFVKATHRALEKIIGDVNDHARKFDEAMRNAAAAFDRLEAAVKPLAEAGFIADLRSLTHVRNITGSMQRAFSDRFGEVARREAPMVQRMQLAMHTARQNAARSQQAA